MPARLPVRFLLLLLAAAALFAALGVRRVAAGTTTKIVARQVSGAVDRSRTFELPIEAQNVAVHWRGARDAHVRVATGPDAGSLGASEPVTLDEIGEQRRNGETYGAVMPAPGAHVV